MVEKSKTYRIRMVNAAMNLILFFAIAKHNLTVVAADGQVLIPAQHINMAREFSYDATDTIGNASQIQQIQHSLNDDMVQAILFRLQAAGKHGLAVPASAASTH